MEAFILSSLCLLRVLLGPTTSMLQSSFSLPVFMHHAGLTKPMLPSAGKDDRGHDVDRHAGAHPFDPNV